MEPIVITDTTELSATLVYTLPTTGDVIIYERSITSGDLIVGSALWALVILHVFREVWKVARGR